MSAPKHTLRVWFVCGYQGPLKGSLLTQLEGYTIYPTTLSWGLLREFCFFRFHRFVLGLNPVQHGCNDTNKYAAGDKKYTDIASSNYRRGCTTASPDGLEPVANMAEAGRIATFLRSGWSNDFDDVRKSVVEIHHGRAVRPRMVRYTRRQDHRAPSGADAVS